MARNSVSIMPIILKSVAFFIVSVITTASATRVSNETSVIYKSSSGSTDSFVFVSETLNQNDIDEGSSLREGVVTIVDTLRGRIKVNGDWLYIVSHKTRLFRNGQAVPASALTVGQLLKFTLLADTSEGHIPSVVFVP